MLGGSVELVLLLGLSDTVARKSPEFEMSIDRSGMFIGRGCSTGS